MRNAVVVGGSRGIGRAVLDRLAVDGWVVCDLSRTTTQVDVTGERFAEVVATVMQETDALVYCAGDVTPRPLIDVSLAEFEYQMAVNVTGAFLALREFARLERKGAVVLVASTAGGRASPNWGAYAASKAALINLAITAAVEMSHRGIRVYCLAPGRCATELRRTLAPEEDQDGIMQPHEVAEVVLTCLNDVDGVLTGQVIEVARR